MVFQWDDDWGFPARHGGTPIAGRKGWFIVENPIYKWMMTGSTPILGNHHADDDLQVSTGFHLVNPHRKMSILGQNHLKLVGGLEHFLFSH